VSSCRLSEFIARRLSGFTSLSERLDPEDVRAAGQLDAARRAPDRQPGAAPEAELRLGRIILLAPRTFHARTSQGVGTGPE
jgi:hypothetical protein